MCVLIMVLFSDCYEIQVALCGSLRLMGSHNGGGGDRREREVALLVCRKRLQSYVLMDDQ